MSALCGERFKACPKALVKNGWVIQTVKTFIKVLDVVVD